MKIARLFAAGVAFSVVLAFCALERPASAAATVQTPFLLTAPGLVVVTMSSQLQCGVVINGPPIKLAATPQYQKSTGQVIIASAIGGGSITQPGSYYGTNPDPVAYAQFQLNVQSFSGTQLSGTVLCGDALPVAAGAGPSGAPGASGAPGPAGTISPVPSGSPPVVWNNTTNVASLNIGACLNIDGSGNLQYNCATPGPQATPSPSVSSNPCSASYGHGQIQSWSGAAPYVLNQAMCVPNYPATVMADPAVTHFWKLADLPVGATPGACPNTLTDSIASGATAVPSAVPLATPSTAASAAPACGSTGILQDGSPSVEFSNSILHRGAYLTIPAAVMDTLCVETTVCTGSFTISCIVNGGSDIGGSQGTWFDIDSTTALDLQLYFNATSPVWVVNAGTATVLASAGTYVPRVIAYSFDGTNSKFYSNGVLSFTAAVVPLKAASTLSFFGQDKGSTGSTAGFDGRMEDCWTANIAESASQIRAFYNATGLP